MRPSERSARFGARPDRRAHPPGSRASRLAGASKQLSILLEDVDLEDEPALAEEVTVAVSAVGRAIELVESGAENERADRLRRADDRHEERTQATERGVRERARIESETGSFVYEAEAE